MYFTFANMLVSHSIEFLMSRVAANSPFVQSTSKNLSVQCTIVRKPLVNSSTSKLLSREFSFLCVDGGVVSLRLILTPLRVVEQSEEDVDRWWTLDEVYGWFIELTAAVSPINPPPPSSDSSEDMSTSNCEPRSDDKEQEEPPTATVLRLFLCLLRRSLLCSTRPADLNKHLVGIFVLCCTVVKTSLLYYYPPGRLCPNLFLRPLLVVHRTLRLASLMDNFWPERSMCQTTSLCTFFAFVLVAFDQ